MRWLDRYALAIPIAFVIATIGPALIGLRTLLSVNLLTGHMPWQAAQGWDAPGHQYCSTDTIDAVVPGIAYTRNAAYAGHLANWQSLVSGGGPLASVPDLGLLDPLSLPYYVLPLWLAPAFVKLLEFVVAIGGTYLFLRRLQRSRLASSLAGVVFASSGFMVMWTNWPQTRVAALIPALFWALERLIQRSRPSDVALIGVVVASMLLGGFPAVTGFALYAAAPYLIVRLIIWHKRRLRPVVTSAALGLGGVVLGGALSAVQMLPFLVHLSNTDLGYRAQSSSTRLPFSGLLTLVDPSSNGLCINAQIYGRFNPVELIAFVGSAATVLAVVAISAMWRSRSDDAGGDKAARGVRTFMLVAVALMIVLGWIGGPVLGLFQHLPVFSNNFVGRLRSVLGFAVAVLVAFGLDTLLGRRRGVEAGPSVAEATVPAAGEMVGEPDRDEATRRHRPSLIPWLWFVGVWAAVAVLAAVVITKAHREGLALHYWDKTRATLLIPALLVAAAMVAALMARTRVAWLSMAGIAVIPILVLGQSVAFFRGVIPGDDPDDFYPKTGTHRFLDQVVGHDRYDATRNTMFPATSLYYGLRAATGHQFIEPEWASLLKAIDPKSRQSPTNYAFSGDITPATVGRSPILDRMGVKYFVFDPSELNPPGSAPLPSDGARMVAPGTTTSCSVPAGALRGVTFTVASPLVASQGHDITAEITVRSGETIVRSARYLAKAVAAGTAVTVAVAGEDLQAATRSTVDISFDGISAAASVGTMGGQVACTPVRPVSDNLKLVYADAGSIVYQRLTALPRIRWASSATVIPDPNARVAALHAGVPAGEVVLDSPGPAGSGQTADVSTSNDSGDRVTATVNARGAGYLVVADALQTTGWSATVDGKSAPLVPADHAMVAVAVGAGTHIVRLSYQAPHQKLGLGITGIGIVVVVALFALDWWLRRGRRRGPGASSGYGEPIELGVGPVAQDQQGSPGAGSSQQ